MSIPLGLRRSVRWRLPASDVIQQLGRAKVLPFLSRVATTEHSVTAVADLHLIVTLRARPEFREGILYGLHKDVGEHLTDFRGIRGQFGEGSLQIVLDTKTWNFYADVDKWNPYVDVIGFVGHSAEVVQWWFKRWWT